MKQITAGMVKELRERTGAGMMECKKALEAANGDIEAAIDALRASGQAKAAKRAGKIAAEGSIIIRIDDQQRNACMVEVNCETDFVARSENFLNFAQEVAACALQAKVENLEDLMKLNLGADQKTVDQTRQELIAKIGENVQIRRFKILRSEGYIGSYLHGNRIGVLVSISRQEPELARDLAMHIAASNPQAVDAAGVSEELIKREREIFITQSKESGKPDNIIEKMVSGRISKFLKEICLVDQLFIKDTEKTVGDLLKSHQTQVNEFVRYEVGEGIEKQTQNFVEEVQAQLKGNAG
jgi:elongation factor Ts